MNTPRLHVAVVGAGPSGFYTAAELIKALGTDVQINLIDRLPTPYGLVRAGVAPDHPKIKTVSAVFAKTAAHPSLHYLGGIEIGRDVSHASLLEHHRAVVYAIGAAEDRHLTVPGRHLAGSFGSAEFVGWYNGHPDQRQLPVDLDTERAVVIGNGNVALDIARILTMPITRLTGTDIAEHALNALARSRIREVVVLGRRGPAHAAWTTSELVELGDLPDTDVVVEGLHDPAAMLPDRAARNANSIQANLEVVRSYAAKAPRHADRRIRLRFCAVPVAIIGSRRVDDVVVADTTLNVDRDGRVRAEASDSRFVLDAGLVISAVGHRSRVPVGVPINRGRGVIRNTDGRVVDAAGQPIPGLYVAGWAKRGPSGVIGTNKQCASATVRALLADLESGALPDRPCSNGFPDLCRARAGVTDWSGWERIDRHELDAGGLVGRPRVKLTDLDAMRRLADAHQSARR